MPLTSENFNAAMKVLVVRAKKAKPDTENFVQPVLVRAIESCMTRGTFRAGVGAVIEEEDSLDSLRVNDPDDSRNKFCDAWDFLKARLEAITEEEDFDADADGDWLEDDEDDEDDEE